MAIYKVFCGACGKVVKSCGESMYEAKREHLREHIETQEGNIWAVMMELLNLTEWLENE